MPGGEPHRGALARMYAVRRMLIGLSVAVLAAMCLGSPARAGVARPANVGPRAASELRVAEAGRAVQPMQRPAPETPLGDTPTEIANAFAQLLSNYQAIHGRYPWRFWPANYLLLGLDPIYWVVGVEGIRYTHCGGYVGLVNVERDRYQLYVEATDGSTRAIDDGQALWLSVADGRAYCCQRPGKVRPEDLSEVRLETLTVVRLG